ncbi:MAG: DUF3352 domain-containing protein [Candidatus Omnitrophota bacterium]
MNSKKVLGLTMVAILVAAGTVFYLRSSRRINVERLTDIMPQGGLAYIYGHNLDEGWERLKGKEIYARLSQSSAFEDIDLFSPIGDSDRNSWLARVGNEFVRGGIRQGVSTLLHNELLLGAFFRSMVAGEKADYDVLLLGRLGKDRKIQAAAIKLLVGLTKDKKASQESYNGLTVNTLRIKDIDEDIVYALAGDVLLISNSRGRIKDALGLIGKRQAGATSLSQDKDFQKARRGLSERYYIWGYLDISGFVRLAQSLTNPLGQGVLAEIKNYFFTLGLDHDGMRIKARSYFSPGPLADEPFMAARREIKNNHSLGVLGLVPLNTVSLWAGHSGNPALAWAYFKDKLKQAGEAGNAGKQNAQKVSQATLSMLNMALGADLEKDILPYLGPEYAFALAGFETINLHLSMVSLRLNRADFDLPTFVAYLEVKDKGKIDVLARGLLDKIAVLANRQFSAARQQDTKQEPSPEDDDTSSTGQPADAPAPDIVSVEEEDYSGADMHFLRIHPPKIFPLKDIGGIFSPGYCFVEKYLVVASNKTLLEKAVNVYKGRLLSLNQGVNFSSLRDKLSERFYALWYLDVPALANPLIKMGRFGETVVPEDYREELQATLEVLEAISGGVKGLGASRTIHDDFEESDVFISLNAAE